MTQGPPSPQVPTQTPSLIRTPLPLPCPGISDSEQAGWAPPPGTTAVQPWPLHPPHPGGEDVPAPGQEEAERPRAHAQGGGLQFRRDGTGRLHVLCHELQEMPPAEPTSEPRPRRPLSPTCGPATSPACPALSPHLGYSFQKLFPTPHIHRPLAKLGAMPRGSQAGRRPGVPDSAPGGSSGSRLLGKGVWDWTVQFWVSSPQGAPNTTRGPNIHPSS